MRYVMIMVVLAGPALAQEPACPFAGQSPMLLVRLCFGQTPTSGNSARARSGSSARRFAAYSEPK